MALSWGDGPAETVFVGQRTFTGGMGDMGDLDCIIKLQAMWVILVYLHFIKYKNICVLFLQIQITLKFISHPAAN